MLLILLRSLSLFILLFLVAGCTAAKNHMEIAKNSSNLEGLAIAVIKLLRITWKLLKTAI